MILLHRLFAHNFKQLTDVTLHLPSTGAVLIEGNNEAGKSSLFEAVFFALYGRPLLNDRDYTLSDLRRYGTDALEVELDFSIGDKQFSIARRVGKNHTAKLIVGDANSSETINSLREVSRRLREEIRLSDDALLNTCYVEQKRLERLEDLDAANRRATINDLLNLRVLTELENKFKVTRDDRDELQTLKSRLEVAQLDTALPSLEDDVLRARRALFYAQALHAEVRRQSLLIEIEDIQAQQCVLSERRANLANELQQYANLQLQLAALDSHVALRLRSWQEALEGQRQTEQRLHELQIVTAELPQRWAQLQEWQLLAARLAELEALEAEVLVRRAEVAARSEKLLRYTGVLQEWQAGEVQRLELAAQYEQAQAELFTAQEVVQLRQQANERNSRLTVLLQHLKSYDRLSTDALEVTAREQVAQEEASRLPTLAAQMEALQKTEAQLQRREEERRTFAQHETELLALQREQEANEELKARRLALASRQFEVEGQVQATEVEKLAVVRTSMRLWSTLSAGIMVFAVSILTGYGWMLAFGALITFYAVVELVRVKQEEKKHSTHHAGVLQELNGLRGELRALPLGLSSNEEDELAESIRVLQQQVQEIHGSLQENVVEDVSLDSLKQQREEITTAHAVALAAQQLLITLRPQIASLHLQLQAETEQLQSLAEELKITGDGIESLRDNAQLEQAAWFEAKANTADNSLQETQEQKRQKVAEVQRQQAILANEQARRRAELNASSQTELEAELAAAESALHTSIVKQEAYSDVRISLRDLELPTQHAVLETHLALVEQRLQQQDEVVDQIPAIYREAETRRQLTEERWQEFQRAWLELFPQESPEPTAAEAELAARRKATQQELAAFDVASLRAEDNVIEAEQTQIGRKYVALQHQQEELLQEIYRKVEELGFTAHEPLSALTEQLPELSSVSPNGVAEQAGVLQRAEDAVRDSRSRRRLAAEAMGLDETLLDVAEVENELAAAEQALAVKRRAGEIVVRTRQGIVGRVMPLTMQNMRRLLPLLTDGRYQDAQWDEENNFIAVYDNLARSFQRKRVFSGGARDQISLALRLAFALATLPGEHNIRPGWLFLDEPLSSFDRPRTLALVKLLTRGLIRRHFSQIFLVSHSESFDPTQFDYRLRMEAGRVIESTLPSIA